MLSFVFLAFAVIHLLIWIFGWYAWSRNERPRALFLILFSGTLLFFDNLRIGSGRFIGEGELLEAMTVAAFAWHWTMLPLLVIAAGIIARRAGLGFAQSKWAIGAFCLVASILIAMDVPKIFELELHPACVADTVRYTTNVSEQQLCRPTDQVVTDGAGAAFVAIATNVIVLLVGIAIWVRHRWPWMALGAGAMFIAAGAFAGSYYALPIANFGEILITLGLIASAIRFRGAPAGQPA
jgi:hypothetical protein